MAYISLHSGTAAALSFWILSVFQVQGQKTINENWTSLRNITMYPACALDSDCEGGRACFQYMCYPWNTSTGFRWCSEDADCSSLTTREDGDGKDGRCYRHKDRENIGFGICLKKIETKKCWTHSDCPSHLRCTNGFCGDPIYFKALEERPCEEDKQCEKLLTGEMCCYDTSAAHHWKSGEDGIKKKCCNNPSGQPVIRPRPDLGQRQMEKLDKGISHLAPYFLDFIVCEGLSYEMMLKLSSCLPYTTTTTTTDRTNQLHHTASSNSLGVDFAVLIAVIGYTWCAIPVRWLL